MKAEGTVRNAADGYLYERRLCGVESAIRVGRERRKADQSLLNGRKLIVL